MFRHRGIFGNVVTESQAQNLVLKGKQSDLVEKRMGKSYDEQKLASERF